ncbi:MAG: type IV pilus modification PilV family protein [Gemmatimonadaceae bacterium]
MKTKRRQAGFSLLETLVAMVLFAAVLLAMLSTGQFILARLYDSDLRFRGSVYAQSIIDSLRSAACARLASGAGSHSAFTGSWIITDSLDVAQPDVTVTVPRRGSVTPRTNRLTTLVNCPEP